jgi:phosphoribosylformylglycinamidine cyclo-ligase
VLVASADGVGTKLKIAVMANRHGTVGHDLVHHCINDILAQGARPLFFLDYVATGRLEPQVVAEVVDGLATACRAHKVALLGGETAEMPGMYPAGEYDLAGFIVGLVERSKILDGRAVQRGDVLVGLPATGLHTNGYSLARHICFEVLGLGIDDPFGELGVTVADELLRVHRCYLEPVVPLLERGLIHALAHITGGGITDNLPRVLGKLGAEIKVGSWEIPEVFTLLGRAGEIPEDDLWRTFNMGVGMILVVAPEHLGEVLELTRKHGCPGSAIGTVVKRSGVRYDHPPDGFPSGLR